MEATMLKTGTDDSHVESEKGAYKPAYKKLLTLIKTAYLLLALQMVNPTA